MQVCVVSMCVVCMCVLCAGVCVYVCVVHRYVLFAGVCCEQACCVQVCCVQVCVVSGVSDEEVAFTSLILFWCLSYELAQLCSWAFRFLFSPCVQARISLSGVFHTLGKPEPGARLLGSAVRV